MKPVKPSSKLSLLTVPRRYFFWGSFVLFMSCVCHDTLSRPCGHLLALVYDVYCDFVTFLFGILVQVW